MIGETISHYQIVGKLGEGGMGAVYEAKDSRLGRHVALKFLPEAMVENPQALARFEREARTISSLNHPYICTLYDIGEHEGKPFLVMERLEGRTLQERLDKGPLDTEEILELGLQIAAALQAAHAKAIVHRDIKPANLFVTEDGDAKILDFGLAKAGAWSDADSSKAETLGSPSELTRPGLAVGTVAYMSPEQALGKELDPRSDLFSLGVVLYEMATSRRPFDDDSPISTLNQILNDDPVPMTQLGAALPEGLRRTIDKCLEKDPDLRCQSAQELVADLKRLSRDVTSGVSTPGLTVEPTAAETTGGGKRLPWLLAAAAMAALAAMTWQWLPRGTESTSAETSSPIFVPFTADGGWKATPSLSPDGERVAYAWRGPTDDFNLYIKALGSRVEPLRLTENPADEIAPAWSPDGRELAFIRLGATGRAIYTLPPLGGRERKLTDLPGPLVPSLSWSSDGRWLACSEAGSDAGPPFRIVLLSTETLEKTVFTSPPAEIGGDFLPAISPDNSHVAFVRRIESSWRNNDIWIQPLAGGEARQLTSEYYAEVLSLSWSADGETLLFSTGPPALGRTHRVPANGGKPELVGGLGVGSAETNIVGQRMVFHQASGGFADLWRTSGRLFQSEATEPYRLAQSNAIDLQPAISPDGNRIAFSSSRSGPTAIWWVDNQGVQPTQLTEYDHIAGTPNWSPDGSRIVFDSTKSGNYDVWVIEVDGGVPRQLTFEPSEDGTPSYSRDGHWIYFRSDRNGALDIWRMPSGGGAAEQVTRGGGFYARESWDGKTLYYAKTAGPTSLWSVPVAGGEESEVIAGPIPLFWDWDVSPSGLYFFQQTTFSELNSYAYGYRGSFALYFRNLSSGETTRLFKREGITKAMAPSVSPDETWMVHVEIPAPEAELVVVEGFQ